MRLPSCWWYLLCSEPGECRVDPRVPGRRCSSWSSWHWRVRILSGPPSIETHDSFWETGTGPRHASGYVCVWKNFLSFVLAQFALGICAFFPLSLYLAVIIPGVWVLQRSSEIGIFREMSISVGAMLCTTVDTCSASVLWWLWTYFTHFLRCGRLEILKHFFSIRFEWREVCLVDASGCSFALRGSHLDTYFDEFHVVELRDDGTGFFAAQCGIFRPPLRS